MPFRVVIAPDKFKGCLGASAVAEAIGRGIGQQQPTWDIVLRPIADGGEGTVDAAVSAGFERVSWLVRGPGGAPTTASFARQGRVAVIEMAEASGLAKLPGGIRLPLDASTYGTGELLRAAVHGGCVDIIVGLGGSATTDGGSGLLSALGVRFLDDRGEELRPGGGALRELARIDAAGLDPAMAGVRIVVASDVAVPLCGPTGAAVMFGPQKGATPADVAVLEAGMMRLAEVMAHQVGADYAGRNGAGAAGGTGFALMAMLGAQIRPGVDMVLDTVGFDAGVTGADLVITGEGAVDLQTLQGKAPVGVLRRARAQAPQASVVIVGGRIDIARPQLLDAGFVAAFSLRERVRRPQESFDRARELLVEIGEEIASLGLPTAHSRFRS